MQLYHNTNISRFLLLPLKCRKCGASCFLIIPRALPPLPKTGKSSTFKQQEKRKMQKTGFGGQCTQGCPPAGEVRPLQEDVAGAAGGQGQQAALVPGLLEAQSRPGVYAKGKPDFKGCSENRWGMEHHPLLHWALIVARLFQVQVAAESYPPGTHLHLHQHRHHPLLQQQILEPRVSVFPFFNRGAFPLAGWLLPL